MKNALKILAGIVVVTILLLGSWFPYGEQSASAARGKEERTNLPIAALPDDVTLEPVSVLNDMGASGVEIEYTFPPPEMTEKEVNGITYQYVHLDGGFGQLSTVGKPALPMRNHNIALPPGSQAQIQILDSQSEVQGNYLIHPALEPARDEAGSPEPEFIIDEEFYESDQNYPDQPVRIIAINELQDIKLAQVQICPVQYNPRRRELTIYSYLKFKVEFIGGTGEPFNIQTQSPQSAQVLKNVVINSESIPAGVEAEESESGTPSPSDIIIITHSDYLEAANSLAVWKRQMGYTVEVISQSNWTASEVKTAIHDRYNSWTPKPGYFIIIGDHDDVPAETSNVETPHVTDLYYACMDGPSDYYPDMAHGRVSVSSASEANDVINKIIDYQRNPSTDSSFYTHGTTCALFQDDNLDGYADRRFSLTSEEIRNHLIDNGYTVDRIYYADSSVTPTNWNNTIYATGDPIPSELLKPGFAWDGDSADIISSIDAGRFLLFHRDHGYSGGTGWAAPYFVTANISSLNNGVNLPVVFSINCHTGEFDLPECFSEAFLRHDSGAVGVFGASDYSFSGYNDGLSLGFIDAIWSDPPLVPSFPHNPTANVTVTPHDPMYTMGNVLNQGKIRMEETWDSSTTYSKYTFELFHYFGDPSMRIWTAVPQTITANHDSQITAGQTSFSISNASCQNGTATLYYNGEIIGKESLSAGACSIALSPSPANPGTAILTITSHNYHPYQVDIDIVSAEGAFVVYNSHNINDSSGNNNGLVDTGESVLLDIVLKNTGTANATDVSANLSTPDQYITVTDSFHTWGTIQAGETVIQADAFAFDVAGDIPDQHEVTFQVQATGMEDLPTPWVSYFNVTVNAPTLAVSSMTIDDSSGNDNGILDPGETVNILVGTLNEGHSDAAATTGALTCSSPDISINNGIHNFGTLVPGYSANASFSVSVNSSAPLGASVDFDYMVTSGAYSANQNFTQTIGQSWMKFINDPVGDTYNAAVPDLIGFDFNRSTTDISLRFNSLDDIDSGNLGSLIYLDTDQNPNTGYVCTDPQFPTNDIGADFIVNAFTSAGGGGGGSGEGGEWFLQKPFTDDYLQNEQTVIGLLRKWNPTLQDFQFVCDFDVTVEANSCWFTIPLTMLEDDGIMDIVTIIGVLDFPTDYAPDQGHGTTTGIALTVRNIQGEPASNAYVIAYTDLSQYPATVGGPYSYVTDEDGYVFLVLDDGAYILTVASLADNFYIVKSDVIATSSLTLNAADETIIVEMQASKTDGSPLEGAGIYPAVSYAWPRCIGYTDAAGEAVVYMTPFVYRDIFLWGYSELYYLYKSDVTVSADAEFTLAFDAAQMPTGGCAFALVDLTEAYIVPWLMKLNDLYTYTAPGFSPQDEDIVTFSEGNYNSWFWLRKTDNIGNLWTFYLPDQELDITAGSQLTLQAGGNFTIDIEPDKASYLPGEGVSLDLLISDNFSNRIVSSNVRLTDASDNNEDSVINIIEGEEYPLAGTDSAEVIESNAPTLTVKKPDGSIYFQITSSDYFYNCNFSLPADAATGYWTATLSFDTGPHQGVIEETVSFYVGTAYALTMAVNGSGSTTPPSGTHYYPVGTVVDISATPDTDWEFNNWDGDVADPGSASTTVTMNADKTATAVFLQEPVVYTGSADDITANSVTLNANLVSLGCYSPVSVSFQWGTTSGALSHETDAQEMTSTGTFSANLSNLSPGTVYYYRAKASANPTVYGHEYFFITAPSQVWYEERIPGTITEYAILPVPGIDIVDLAINGNTVYAATNHIDYPLFKSTDGGYTWSNLEDAAASVKSVAIAPDDADQVAIITSENEVRYSSNGGSMWSDLGKPADANTLNDIDVSTGTTRYIAVGGNRTNGNAELFTIRLALAQGWNARMSGAPGSAPGQTDVKAVKFSPNFPADKAIAVISGNTTGATFQLYHDELGDRDWNGEIDYLSDNWSTGIKIADITGRLAAADIALPASYNATASADRLAFYGVAGTTSGGGVGRLADIVITEFQTWSGGDEGPICSVAYHESDKLIAGGYDENQIYQFLDPWSVTPKASRLNTLKQPGGVNKTIVGWPGDTAVAATSGIDSAFSVSNDDGYTWNDISLINTTISNISDVAVNAEGTKVYLATSDGTNTSIWLKASAWKRVLNLEGYTGIITRIAPDDDSVIYLADTSSEDIWVSQDSGLESWRKRPCYTLGSGDMIRDMAIESVDVAYVIDDDGVSKTTNVGASWGAQKRPVEPFTPCMITLAPDGDVLVGGSSGYIAFSRDGGDNYERTTYIGPGKVQVLADNDHAINNILYAGVGSKIYRGYATNFTGFLDLGPLIASSDSIVGMTQYENAIYALSSNMTDSTLHRALELKTASTPEQALWSSYPTTLEFEATPRALKLSLGPKLWAIDTPDKLYSYYDIIPQPLKVTTSPAAGIATDSAVLRGSLDSLYIYGSANVSFEWGTASGNLSQNTSSEIMAVTGDFSAGISGLTPGSTYYFRAKASANPVVYGDELSFTTATPVPPASPSGGGGGGVSSLRPGETILSDSIDSNGIFTSDITAKSEDKLCFLEITKGVRGLTKYGKPLSKIRILEVEGALPAPEGHQIVDKIYDISPDEATYEPAITLTICYDPELLSENVSEKELYIACWTGENWTAFESTVDMDAKMVSTGITHFTEFAVIGKPPSPPREEPEEIIYRPATRPAAFEVSGLAVTPSETRPGEEVMVSVMVTNTGGCTGSRTVTLYVDGAEEDSREVNLGANKSETLTFVIKKEARGTYEVEIDEITSSFTIAPTLTAVIPEEEPEEQEKEEEPVFTTRWIIGTVISACVILLGLLAYFFIWRKGEKTELTESNNHNNS